jgi:hypothetical protein
MSISSFGTPSSCSGAYTHIQICSSTSTRLFSDCLASFGFPLSGSSSCSNLLLANTDKRERDGDPNPRACILHPHHLIRLFTSSNKIAHLDTSNDPRTSYFSSCHFHRPSVPHHLDKRSATSVILLMGRSKSFSSPNWCGGSAHDGYVSIHHVHGDLHPHIPCVQGQQKFQ